MAFGKRVLVHSVFWVFHFIFGFFAWDYKNYHEGHLIEFATVIVTSHITTLLYFYSNYFIWVPQLLLKRKYVSYVLVIISATVLFVLSKAYIWNSFSFIDGLLVSHQKSGLVFNIIFFFCLSTAFKMYDSWQESENQKIALLQEVKETELLYLKSQMSPHFLFNTLNNIYGLSLNNSPKTSLSIRHLKDLMLYIETFETGDKISIDREVQYLNSFIALNQLRYAVPVHFEITGDQLDKVFIEPMLFLPFIENAFKHGGMEQDSEISISLSITHGAIHFQVTNAVAVHKRKDTVGGIGIKNVMRRLELLYTQSFWLTTGSINQNRFNVDLQIKTA